MTVPTQKSAGNVRTTSQLAPSSEARSWVGSPSSVATASRVPSSDTPTTWNTPTSDTARWATCVQDSRSEERQVVTSMSSSSGVASFDSPSTSVSHPPGTAHVASDQRKSSNAGPNHCDRFHVRPSVLASEISAPRSTSRSQPGPFAMSCVDVNTSAPLRVAGAETVSRSDRATQPGHGTIIVAWTVRSQRRPSVEYHVANSGSSPFGQ